MTEDETRLGAILVRTMGLPLRVLQEALDRQKRAPTRKLGDILLEMQAIDDDHLRVALEIQKHSRHVSLLGAILVRSAGLPLRTLQDALDRQKKEPGLRLGEILLAMRVIDAAQLASALQKQEELRRP